MTGRRDALDQIPGLRALARIQLGVVRRDQLLDLGITHDHVRSQVRARRWTTIGPRVVVLSTGVLTRAQRRAVGLAHGGPESSLAGLTCLEHRGLRGWERHDVHVAVPHGVVTPRLSGVVVHQCVQLDDGVAPGGWPACTTAARAAVDAASWERSPAAASGLILAVVQQRLASADEIVGVLDGSARVRHRALLRSILVEAGEGADSRAEVDVARLMRQVGLVEIRRQVVVETPDGPRPVDLTARLPDGRVLAVEVDGPHHQDPRVREADAVKDAALVAAGYVVLRIPVSLLRRSPATVRRQLQTIVDSARP